MGTVKIENAGRRQDGRFVGPQAVQLHGGMGMTDELAVGRYFKRITAMDGLFGGADQHLAAFARG